MQVTRRLEFDYAHRLPNHKGLCQYLHGHRGRIEASVSFSMDAKRDSAEYGMVLDFGRLTRILEDIIEKYDHATLLDDTDPLVPLLLGAQQRVVSLEGPPTAEFLAARIGRELLDVLGMELAQVTVRFYETPNCWAQVTL